jgi:eukaryotic-like serine/threonine-protein kinase
VTPDAEVLDLLAEWETDGRRASPEELCVRSPHLLPKLQQCMDRLSSIDRLLAEPAADQPKPPVIYGYEVEHLIARGGMGLVWRAVQLSTRRAVALKLTSTGQYVSPRGRLRFEREVELASRLTHPNIARVYDSGLHDGMLFYAMELIEGVRIDEHVRSRNLSRRQVLELMQTVCRAAHHAHQLGVIHRDLKPSNILVGENGQPHLLDFGLAKEIWEESSPQITQDEAPGTPAYMSPEQASGQSRRVGTASDVYALGVVLYQLLLGRLPHDVSGSSIQVMRRIASEEPTRPRAVDSTLPRDLEAILLKALSREPEQRYASADAMARDLESWIEGKAIGSMRTNWRYVAAKFARRHKYKLITAAGLISLPLMIGVFAYVRIAHERDRAETSAAVSAAVNDFLVTMISSAMPEGSGGPVPTLPEMLDRAGVRIDGAFPNQPLVEASVRSTIGITYMMLGFGDRAEPHLRAAYGLRLRALGDAHPQTLAILTNLAAALYDLGRHREAETLLRKGLATAEQALGPHDDSTLQTMSALISSLYYQRRYAEAEQIARQRHHILLSTKGPAHPDTRGSAETLASVLSSLGSLDEAERILRESERRLSDEPDHRYLAAFYLKLGTLLHRQGKLEEADDAMSRCVQARITFYGPDHTMVGYAKVRLGNLKEQSGKLDEAEQLFRDALRIDEQRQHTLTVDLSLMGLVRILRAQGRQDEAEPLLERAWALAEQQLAKTDLDVSRLIVFADALIDLDMPAEAVAFLTRAVAAAERHLPHGQPGLEKLIEARNAARSVTPRPAPATTPQP